MTMKTTSINPDISPDTSHRCKKCGKSLIPDEIAMTKKLINRGATVYYCTDCLAKAFEVKKEDIEAKIRYFKDIGCTLFVTEGKPFIDYDV